MPHSCPALARTYHMPQDWRLYILQELCDGGTLRQLVVQRASMWDHDNNMPHLVGT